MSHTPDLTGKVTVPVFHLMDKVAGKWLALSDGQFVWTGDLSKSVFYSTEDEAVEAAGRAGGDVKVVGLLAYVDAE